MLRRILGLLVLGLLATGTVAQDDEIRIIASHSILADVVQNVVGDTIEVGLVMPVGADPHTFEPTPRDLTAVADADVVFVNGAFFEEGLLEGIENAADGLNVVEASACVEIIPFGAAGHSHGEGEDEEHDHGEEEAHEEGEEHDHGEEDAHEEGEEHDHGEEEAAMEGGMSAMADLCAAHKAEFDAIHEMREDEHAEGEDHGHEHEHGGESVAMGPLYAIDCGEGHEHEHGEEEEGEGHEHGAGSCDPHVWMEPHNVMYWTMLVRDTLVEMDPANAETYTANADAYLLELDALMHDFVMPLVETIPEENRVLVTNHESLGYFANRFDFEVATTVLPGGGTAAEPSAADIAEIIEVINEEGVPAVFAETTVADVIAEQIATETGAQLVVLYSGSLSETDGPAATYIDYITFNVTAIAEALGGGM